MPSINWPILGSTLIFVVTFIGILTERVHRTLVAIMGAVVMVTVGTWLSFYSPEQAVEATDSNTIMLLLGMMIIVALFHTTGFFQYLAIWAAKLARGKPWFLFVYLGVATTLVSMLLDNVTTIILMIPVTLSLADILGIPVVPFLVSEVMLSNVGGVATLIGDPPNILIGSAAGFSFTDFLVHLAPIVVVTWLVCQVMLLLLFRSDLKHPAQNVDKLQKMDPRRALTDPRTTRRMLIVLAGTLILFFLHDLLHLETGTVAMFGASGGLLWLWPKIRETLARVQWDVLLFFVALFIIVGGMQAAGTLGIVAAGISTLMGHGVVVGSLVILWTAAIMSAVVDNVPFTIVMLPILAGLGAHGVDVTPLWWALALGVGFGGNATPIGATANVIAISISKETDTPITSKAWIRRGQPIAIASCVVASVLDVIGIYIGLF